MDRDTELPPIEWDPRTVIGVRERLQISGFGIKKPINFQDQISQHKWRFAAGDTVGKTKEQALQEHQNARERVWDVVMMDRARDESKRTDERER